MIAAVIAQIVPSTTAAPPNDTDVCAKTLPGKDDPAPSVAEDPTRKNTLDATAPPERITLDRAEETKVSLILKIHWDVAEPVRVRSAVSVTLEGERVSGWVLRGGEGE